MMEIVTEKVKLKLTPEEAQQLIEDDTFDVIVNAVISLEESLKIVNDFPVVKEEIVNKVVEKVKKENRKGSDNLIEKLYENLFKNSDSDLTQNG
jgi:exoribonuclease II